MALGVAVLLAALVVSAVVGMSIGVPGGGCVGQDATAQRDTEIISTVDPR